MNDKELLELAAKAAGIKVLEKGDGYWMIQSSDRGMRGWNPLLSYSDALRLAARLDMPMGFDDRWKDLGFCAYATYPTGEHSCNSIMQNVDEAGGREPALRRAIVRAAAEIGKSMP